MSGSGQSSCRICQNACANTLSKGVDETHQVDLERSQMSQALKRLYQATSTTSRNILGKSVTSTLMKQTHQVEIEPLEAIEVSRRHREPPRAIWTTQMLSTTPDTIADTPEAAGMSALRQVRGPVGYLDERAKSGDVGDCQMTQSGGDGIQGVGK